MRASCGASRGGAGGAELAAGDRAAQELVDRRRSASAATAADARARGPGQHRRGPGGARTAAQAAERGFGGRARTPGAGRVRAHAQGRVSSSRGAGRAPRRAGGGVPRPPRASATRSGAAFVGRGGSSSACAPSLSSVDGGGRIALLEGEPGIGKTRLATQFMAACEAAGALPCTAAATPTPWCPISRSWRRCGATPTAGLDAVAAGAPSSRG